MPLPRSELAAVIVDLDAQSWAHVAMALRLHRGWCRENAVPIPDDVRALAEHADRARNGDRGRLGTTGEAVAEALVHAAVMNTALALTYADAARRLGVSTRHVQRLVASGVLATVQVGGAPRVRAVDLEAYVAELAPQHRGFREHVVEKATS